MKKIILIFLFLISSTLLFSHKLSIFAYYEDGKLNIESFYSDGTPCKNCDFTIYNDKGKKILSGKLDEKGEKIIPMKLNSNIKIDVNASMGHFASFKLKIQPTNKKIEKVSNINKNPSPTNISMNELRKIIDEELEKQLRPIILELAKIEGNKVEKIVSAFGYIFGILGLIAIFKRK